MGCSHDGLHIFTHKKMVKFLHTKVLCSHHLSLWPKTKTSFFSTSLPLDPPLSEKGKMMWKNWVHFLCIIDLPSLFFCLNNFVVLVIYIFFRFGFYKILPMKLLEVWLTHFATHSIVKICCSTHGSTGIAWCNYCLTMLCCLWTISKYIHWLQDKTNMVTGKIYLKGKLWET